MAVGTPQRLTAHKEGQMEEGSLGVMAEDRKQEVKKLQADPRFALSFQRSCLL